MIDAVAELSLGEQAPVREPRGGDRGIHRSGDSHIDRQSDAVPVVRAMAHLRKEQARVTVELGREEQPGDPEKGAAPDHEAHVAALTVSPHGDVEFFDLEGPVRGCAEAWRVLDRPRPDVLLAVSRYGFSRQFHGTFIRRERAVLDVQVAAPSIVGQRCRPHLTPGIGEAALPCSPYVVRIGIIDDVVRPEGKVFSGYHHIAGGLDTGPFPLQHVGLQIEHGAGDRSVNKDDHAGRQAGQPLHMSNSLTSATVWNDPVTTTAPSACSALPKASVMLSHMVMSPRS